MVKPSRARSVRRLSRSTSRLTVCPTIRPLNRAAIRNLPAYNWGPDYLGQALRALQRAINTHKKLARLAPQYFDSTEVDRLAYLRMEEAERRATREPVLNRVYGCSDDPRSAAPPSQYLPQPPALASNPPRGRPGVLALGTLSSCRRARSGALSRAQLPQVALAQPGLPTHPDWYRPRPSRLRLVRP